MQTHVIARTAIFDDQDRLLLLRRSDDDDYRPGGMDIPGGRVDEGETILQGALREVQEETGLSLDPAGMKLLFATNDVHFHTEVKADVNFVWLGFVGVLPEAGKVRVSHEHQEYVWTTVDEAIGLTNSRDQQSFLAHIRDHNLRDT